MLNGTLLTNHSDLITNYNHDLKNLTKGLKNNVTRDGFWSVYNKSGTFSIGVVSLNIPNIPRTQQFTRKRFRTSRLEFINTVYDIIIRIYQRPCHWVIFPLRHQNLGTCKWSVYNWSLQNNMPRYPGESQGNRSYNGGSSYNGGNSYNSGSSSQSYNLFNNPPRDRFERTHCGRPGCGRSFSRRGADVLSQVLPEQCPNCNGEKVVPRLYEGLWCLECRQWRASESSNPKCVLCKKKLVMKSKVKYKECSQCDGRGTIDRRVYEECPGWLGRQHQEEVPWPE